MPPYQVDQVENNLTLRVQYLRKMLNEDDFKTKIQRNNKQHEKKRETGEVLHLFTQTTTDIMHRLYDHVQKNTRSKNVMKEDIREYLKEVNAIRLYTNECLLDIANTYHHKAKHIRPFVVDPKMPRDMLVNVA
jgi:hypothetical protein